MLRAPFHTAICLVIALSSTDVAFCGPQEFDDLLGLLQSSLRVKQNGLNEIDPVLQAEESDMSTPEYALPTQQSLAKLEEMILNRVREGRTNANDTFVEMSTKMITNMKNGILASKLSNQKLVNKSLADFKGCDTALWQAYASAIPEEKDFARMSIVNQKCRAAQTALDTEVSTAQAEIDSIKTIIVNKLKTIDAFELPLTAGVCETSDMETYPYQINRLKTYFDTNLKKSQDEWNALNASRVQQKTLENKLVPKTDKQNALKKKCALIRKIMDTEKCNAVTILKTACTNYSDTKTGCYFFALKNYNSTKKTVETEEKDMKVEWRALERMQCFLGVLDTNTTKSNNDTLNECIDKDARTEHLDIWYGQIPPIESPCPLDPKCPCEKRYVKDEHNGAAEQCTTCLACQ